MLVAIKPHFENMFLVLLDCVFAYNAKLFEMGLFHKGKHDIYYKRRKKDEQKCHF